MARKPRPAKSDNQRREKRPRDNGKRFDSETSKPQHTKRGGEQSGGQHGSGPKNANRSKRTGGGAKPDDRVFLYGLHTVRAALDNPKRESLRLYVSEAGLSRIGELPHDLEILQATPAQLQNLVNAEAVHQGVVLECKPLALLDSSELFHLADESLLLALDQVTDPHNVGAILRSAVAMGVGAVLLTHRNSAPETAVLAKSASGALEMVKTVNLRNFSKGLDELNEMGFSTIGLDSEGPLELEETLAAAPRAKICLVLGSEGKGLRQQTRESCTALTRLDMPGEIKSLNVSNAAALSLYLAHKRVTQK